MLRYRIRVYDGESGSNQMILFLASFAKFMITEGIRKFLDLAKLN